MANPVLERRFGTATADSALQTTPTPPADGRSTMSIGSVILSTIVLLALVMAGAAYGWANAAAVQRWYWLLAVTMIALLIATVARPKLVVLTGVFYSLVQGALLGSLS
ncbi:MAG TPA: Bax inhibitor-1/YccA family protein, partial [Acidimicrobiia bacterium]